jgi:phosphoglycerol transferase MdoB-like AlkP superfamily enzyme
MKERLKFIISYYITSILLFVPLRLLFLAINSEKGYSAADYLNVAFHGLQLDVAVAGYVSALPLLLCIASIFVKLPLRKIMLPYNILIAATISLAFIADASLYPFWGFKLDSTFLQYIDSPENALASVTIGYLFVRFAFFIALTTLVALIFYRITPEIFKKANKKVVSLLLFILAGGFIFLGIRGGVKESTNNVGQVYYSDDLFLNHSAVNPIFSFIYSLSKNQDFGEVYNFFDEKERSTLFDSLYTTDNTITDTLLNTTRPNIVTIILEGMSSVFIDEHGGEKAVAKNMSKLINEGVLFTNCYANSYRTDRGLICLLSGYPSFPQISVMKSPMKSQTLPAIAGSLSKAGYHNTFLYGGDINFTNMKGYIFSGGYNNVIADTDFPREAQKSHQWGVTDHITFDTLASIIARQPKYKNWNIGFLTLSSHEPWTVPHNSVPEDKVANSFAYVDSCLGIFVDKMKKSDAWDNMLVVCIPDHAVAYYPKDADRTDKRRTHIPLLMFGGAIKEPRRIDALCNQTDLAATLLAQMQLPTDEYKFSRNILSPAYKYPFAYHAYNNGIQFIDSTGFSLLDLDSGVALKEEPADPEHSRLNKAKAILQSTYQDYKNR